MPRIPAKQIVQANRLVELAAEDAIPAHGTIGQRIACGILRQITEHVRDNPVADLSGEDCAFLRTQLDLCRRRLQPGRKDS